MITTVLAFLLTLGVLIVVHEYGHYRVAVACAASRAYPEVRGVAAAAAFGVVAAQVLRGAHFPSDVTAGALVGFTAETVVHRIGSGWNGRAVGTEADSSG